MTDFAAARRHMVDGQIRTTDVTDLRVISAMLEVPRERFMPPAVDRARLSRPRRAGGRIGRRLLRPMVLAKLIQAAELEATDRVLDVGCATGYARGRARPHRGPGGGARTGCRPRQGGARGAVGAAECRTW